MMSCKDTCTTSNRCLLFSAPCLPNHFFQRPHQRGLVCCHEKCVSPWALLFRIAGLKTWQAALSGPMAETAGTPRSLRSPPTLRYPQVGPRVTRHRQYRQIMECLRVICHAMQLNTRTLSCAAHAQERCKRECMQAQCPDGMDMTLVRWCEPCVVLKYTSCGHQELQEHVAVLGCRMLNPQSSPFDYSNTCF